MNEVKMWEEKVKIPTYSAGEPDKNPMFFEKRVYQGSSGKIYPLPFTEKIDNEKTAREYKMVYLENDYLKIAVMPELGGRIQRAYDKTNDYDFVYYNQVIKPALVGLAGPWIAGGIEFNWPQHHRPRTFSPVEYYLEENEDGSKTIWVSEIDRMYGTKGMAGLTLHPDKAYLKIKGQLYNKTSVPQTFLWWANPAVAVNDQYKAVFPPDVHAVFDHGKRDVSKFPIATDEYYKVDYSAGVDISKYKNIPVPTSYMAYHSDYDFVGGYDFGKEAGILHIADHNISPGKKLWTWGNGDFGKAWYRNLTDEDGPYIELMTGVYSDNQPDFTWLEPYEEKTFTQYFMPYKQVGDVKNATIDAAVNLEFKGDKAFISVYTTSAFKDLQIELTVDGQVHTNEKIDISPAKPYTKTVKIDKDVRKNLYKLSVIADEGRTLVSYRPETEKIVDPPEPAKPAPEPEDIKYNEDLYLTGLHLEQYRHATYEPDPYYLEGLKRNPGDIRINNAYGKLLFKRGLFEKSEDHFRRAIKTLTQRNPNPYNGEPYYNLGLTLKKQGRLDEGFEAFFKSVWNGDLQGKGYYALAQIALLRGDYREGLKYIEKSIVYNFHNTKARNLKAAILRYLKKYDEAEELVKETIQIDKLDFTARNELYQIYYALGEEEKAGRVKEELIDIMRDDYHNYLEVAIDYGESGLFTEAVDLLARLEKRNKANEKNHVYPMIFYYLGYYHFKLNNDEEGINYYRQAAKANSDYCFPNRLNSILVLREAIKKNPADAKAPYYLGNLFYDKKQYEKAIKLWEESRQRDSTFPTVHRNLALGYYNKLDEKEKAKDSLEKAFKLDQTDDRILFELDQLYKKLRTTHQDRIEILDQHFDLVKERDDLYTEYVTLCNNLGEYERALKLIENRRFHPWEGGEGKITSQYELCHVELAKKQLKKDNYQEAVKLLKKAKTYPKNLGEGKLPIAQDNRIDYYLGYVHKKMEEESKARRWFREASKGREELADSMSYNDLSADMVFYQGLALLELGEEKKAKAKFNKLYDYGEKHLFDDVKIDYFAVSLPDFLVFDTDLNKRNKAHCRYLMGLGLLGQGKINRGEEELKRAKKLDPNHQGVLVHLKMKDYLKR